MNTPERFLLAILVVTVAVLAIVVLGGKVFSLQRDEVYFLHEAYALKQGWLETPAARSYAYDLYVWWLSLGMRMGMPESLWTAVMLDTVLQGLCGIILLWVAFKEQSSTSWLGFLAVLAGLLFFFSIGRLGDHRPDYLAATSLALGIFCLLRAFLASAQRSVAVSALAAGAFLAVAVCFSPRVMVILACSLPLLSFYLLRYHGATVCIRVALFGLAGFVGCVGVVWVVTGFSLWSSWTGLGVIRADTELWVSLFDRFTDRKRLVMVLMHSCVLGGALWMFRLHSSARERLFAWAAFSIVAGQFFLIWFDSRIYVYGYSLGLVAYLLLLVPVFSGRNSTHSVWLPRAFLAILAGIGVLLLSQVTFGYAASNFYALRKIELRPSFGKGISTERLIKRTVKRRWLVPKIRSRIILCDRFDGFLYLSEFKDGPICLQSGFKILAGTTGLLIDTDRPVPYPRKKELEQLLQAYDLPQNAKGMLFQLTDAGEVKDVIPLR